MSSPAVNPLHLSDLDFEPELEIDPVPVPVMDPPLPVQPLRGGRQGDNNLGDNPEDKQGGCQGGEVKVHHCT